MTILLKFSKSNALQYFFNFCKGHFYNCSLAIELKRKGNSMKRKFFKFFLFLVLSIFAQVYISGCWVSNVMNSDKDSDQPKVNSTQTTAQTAKTNSIVDSSSEVKSKEYYAKIPYYFAPFLLADTVNKYDWLSRLDAQKNVFNVKQNWTIVQAFRQKPQDPVLYSSIVETTNYLLLGLSFYYPNDVKKIVNGPVVDSHLQDIATILYIIYKPLGELAGVIYNSHGIGLGTKGPAYEASGIKKFPEIDGKILPVSQSYTNFLQNTFSSSPLLRLLLPNILNGSLDSNIFINKIAPFTDGNNTYSNHVKLIRTLAHLSASKKNPGVLITSGSHATYASAGSDFPKLLKANNPSQTVYLPSLAVFQDVMQYYSVNNTVAKTYFDELKNFYNKSTPYTIVPWVDVIKEYALVHKDKVFNLTAAEFFRIKFRPMVANDKFSQDFFDLTDRENLLRFKIHNDKGIECETLLPKSLAVPAGKKAEADISYAFNYTGYRPLIPDETLKFLKEIGIDTSKEKLVYSDLDDFPIRKCP